jgi:hypothetical protein
MQENLKPFFHIIMFPSIYFSVQPWGCFLPLRKVGGRPSLPTKFARIFFCTYAKGSLWLDQMVRLNQSHNSSKANATAQSVLVCLLSYHFGLIIITWGSNFLSLPMKMK